MEYNLEFARLCLRLARRAGKHALILEYQGLRGTGTRPWNLHGQGVNAYLKTPDCVDAFLDGYEAVKRNT